VSPPLQVPLTDINVLAYYQGAGAVPARIETARRHFPRIVFNADATEAGRDAGLVSRKEVQR
jgi:hypothetical protein